jgi:serine phosphatase RsbU (regulator of sigma subunit)
MEVWGGNCEVFKSFEMPGLESVIFSRPHGASKAGGDVYYLSSCASGRISRLLLADVSGHGAEVAELGRGLRDLMRKNVNVIRQKRFVEGMNRQFVHLAAQGAFATALVATYFQPARRFSLCNAGHPHPLFYDASADRWSVIGESESTGPGLANLPLGLHDQTVYEQSEMTLDAGDMILFYSDALTESLTPAGNLLQTDGLLKLVSELQVNQPATILQLLLEAVHANHPQNAGQDDLTMMLCRATGTATTLRDNLLAPLRLFRPVHDNTTWR